MCRSTYYLYASANPEDTVGEPIHLFKGSGAPWRNEEISPGTEPLSDVTDGNQTYRSKTGELLMLWSSWDDGSYVQTLARSESRRLDGPWEQLDPMNTDRVYASADVPPASGDTTATSRYQLFRGERDGPDWSWTQMTETTGADNLRPFVPRGTGDRRIVLWMQGPYASYTGYDTDVVGRLR